METNVIVVMIGLTLHVHCSDRTPGIQRDRPVIRIDIGQRDRIHFIEINVTGRSGVSFQRVKLCFQVLLTTNRGMSVDLRIV